MTKPILLLGMLAGIAGCEYVPDYGISEYPIEESSKYALAPNTRWTSLRYNEWTPLSKEGVWEMMSETMGQYVPCQGDILTIVGLWRGGAGRSAATAAATSRGRCLTRLAAKGTPSTCSGAAFPAPTRQASVPKRLCG